MARLSSMPSGKNNKAVRHARSVASAGNATPWATIAAVVVVLLFAAGIFGFLYAQYSQGQQTGTQLAAFTPSANNKDPSTQIQGIQIEKIEAAGHVTRDQRVDYQEIPPLGGPHDAVWAACNGVVYEQPVRTENMVHSMEHGTVWISYNPDKVPDAAVAQLADRVRGRKYLMLSPIPTQQAPISLQSWGHQLTVASADDPRIDQFITALRHNPYTYPEVGASCEPIPGRFDPDDPPPFNPAPPGPDAVPLSYTGGR